MSCFFRLVHSNCNGVISQEGLFSWNALMELSDKQEFPRMVPAITSISTLQAILQAMKKKRVIALIDPSTPNSLANSFQRQLNLFLQGEESGFGIVLLTSGTTSSPKMLLLREQALYFSALGATEFFAINSDSNLALSLPLHHVSGLSIFFRALIAGASLYLIQGSLLKGFAEMQHKITHLSLVRTQAARLIETGLLHYSSLKCLLLGGSSFPQELVQKMRGHSLPCFLSYGMSESASLVWAYSLQEEKGRVLPYRLLSSRDKRIYIGGKTLFAGYIHEDGKLISPIVDGYLETADEGVFDEPTQMLTITGRADDVFLFGGENISAQELEASLAQIPEVQLALVSPLSSLQYGTVPLAILFTPLECPLSTWREKFASVLPKAKMPKVVITIESLAYVDEPDVKQRLSQLKKQVIEKLASFEALEEEEWVQKWIL